MSKLLETVVAIAKTQIGVLEEPPGSNRGKQVDKYHQSVGLNPSAGNPWCMAFVYWCFMEASVKLGVTNPAIKLAHCLNVWKSANKLTYAKQVTAERAKKDWKLVKPGMIFILEISPLTRAGHTGVVESVNYQTGIMTTIEGNTNELTMTREGVGVFRLTRRKIASINVGFINYTLV